MTDKSLLRQVLESCPAILLEMLLGRSFLSLEEVHSKPERMPSFSKILTHHGNQLHQPPLLGLVLVIMRQWATISTRQPSPCLSTAKLSTSASRLMTPSSRLLCLMELKPSNRPSLHSVVVETAVE